MVFKAPMDNPKNHLLSILLTDEPSAHERLANALRRRAPDVVSTSFASDEETGHTRVTIVLRATPFEVEAFRKHVEKLIDVVEATVVEACVAVQWALLRVRASGAARADAAEAFRRYGAKILRDEPDGLVAQMGDQPERIEAALTELSALGPTTAMRTGLVAMVV